MITVKKRFAVTVFKPNSPETTTLIHELITSCGGDPNSTEGGLTTQMIQTSIRFLLEKHDTGQIKLITRAVKELRHAFNVFNQYPNIRRISMFGSARTPEDHPDYQIAKKFSALMAEQDWMCITGAAHGIMKAGLEGSTRQGGFGLSIRLPFEIPISEVIDEDPKHILFRYFFTRKLMFLSQADCVVALPGGFGTLDELFEVLTLMQTGKGDIIPVVLLEHPGGSYWRSWEHYMNEHLLAQGLISSEDQYLYHITYSAEEAVKHVLHFYRRYHSSRYVDDYLVIRLLSPLTQSQVDTLNKMFSGLIASGKIEMSGPLEKENELQDLPRLIFRHNRRNFGLLRAMIDHINDF